MAFAGRRFRFKAWLALAGVFFAAASHAEERFLIQVPAVYDDNAPVEPAVRRECGIESLVGNHVFKEVSARYPGSLQAKGPEGGTGEKFLKLSVVSVQGTGGGNWSGGKTITIRIDLLQNAKP